MFWAHCIDSLLSGKVERFLFEKEHYNSENRAGYTCYETPLFAIKEKALRTYGSTDGPTDGRSDGPTDGQTIYRDAWTHLKKYLSRTTTVVITTLACQNHQSLDIRKDSSVFIEDSNLNAPALLCDICHNTFKAFSLEDFTYGMASPDV